MTYTTLINLETRRRFIDPDEVVVEPIPLQPGALT